MDEKVILKAERRADSGTRASRKLRRQGFIPAIIYGHKKEPVSVKLNSHDLALELQHHHRLLNLDLEGKAFIHRELISCWALLLCRQELTSMNNRFHS